VSFAAWLADDLGMVDVQFRDHAKLIAAWVMPTTDGLALLECGPTTTLPNLLAGLHELDLDPNELRHLLLTHIHLDHAGAAGTLLDLFPNLTLYVHEAGAPHMIDPSRLIQSATRVYGDRMDVLWGDFLPCPAERVVVLRDGDRLELGGLTLDVLYTPGHASHHVAFYRASDGSVVAGDAAGIRVPPSQLVWPPTPPPDVDIEAWHASLDRLRAVHPRRLLVTHFGAFDDVDRHLDLLDRRLDDFSQLVAGWQAEGLERDAIAMLLEQFADDVTVAAGEPLLAPGMVENVTPFGMTVDGILRYLRRRAA
jgi:glyoxylase-like metal-dependent hydrolase (beta-lactamase superfamily II)